MVSRDHIAGVLRELNAAENNRPNTTVEATSARIDKLMAPDVHGWRAGVTVPDRAAERENERLGFGALQDYHRDFDQVIIDPPMACINWTIRGSFNGKPVVAPGASIFRFSDDGLIVQYWMYINPNDFSYRREYAAANPA
ncbi:nuclear transport factor 2 family protein [Phenylobacterium sp.]|jgi:hypothetical protein|uniref:nuclear transport factor 2 family protein n=1 Tax=Phenylobacterium sp. TaxID=1871053 RepID=UPI002F4035D1